MRGAPGVTRNHLLYFLRIDAGLDGIVNPVFVLPRSAVSLRLPFAMTITQGDEIYRYRPTEVDTNWVPAAGFEPAG